MAVIEITYFAITWAHSVVRVTVFVSIPMFLCMTNPMVPIKKSFSRMYFKVNDKTHFAYVFGLVSFANTKKTPIQLISVVYSVYYDKQ